ncbi:MAG: MFS transporter [Verrucomicrobia bacterium]|nr:MFS transporter [Verrucomicrobiota bacterium]
MSQLAPNPEVLDRAIRRAKWRLIPFMLLMYLLCYLDRANIGFAKQSFQAATGVSDAAFAFGAGAFFITYALFEIPSNLILHRVGARRWMARIMVSWGLISAAMIFAKSDTSFSVLRLLLGAAEAGFFPGSILFLTYWFPAQARGQIMAIFYFGAPLALMFGGPLSGMLLDFGSRFGVQGWQLMFAVEGLLASLVGVWAFFYLTDRPAKASWMPQDERDALTQAIDAEEQVKQARGTVTLGAVFRNPRLLHFVAIYFLIQISGYGVAFYLPTQVSALMGENVGLRVGFVTAIPWAFAIIAGSFWPALAMRTGYRRTFAFLSLTGIAVGLSLSANLPPALAIAALCLVTAGIITAQPIFWTFPTAYFGGIGAAAGIATINALGNIGGFVAPPVKTWLEHRFSSTTMGLYFLGFAGFLAALLVTRLRSSDVTQMKEE